MAVFIFFQVTVIAPVVTGQCIWFIFWAVGLL